MFLIHAFSLAAYSFPAEAEDSVTICPTMTEVLKNLTLSPDGVPQDARAALIKQLRENQIPAYLKTTSHGDVPVILVNSKTAPEIKDFLDHSIGTQAALQPDFTNDHGQFRLAQYVVDVADPGKRGFGELNANGIAWKPMDSLLAIRNKAGDAHGVLLEVAYALKPEELEVADYYQKMRRASLVRAPFVLDTVRSDLNLPNTLLENGTAENCYVFCKGLAINNQIATIQKNLKNLGIPDVNQFYADPRTQDFLSRVRKYLLSANPSVPAAMHFNVVDPYLPILASYFQPIDQNTLRSIGNWVVGLDASARYRDLLRNLKVTNDVMAADINNPRATALLIYDSTAEADRFKDATYFYQGAGTAGSGAKVGGPGPWISATSDQKPLYGEGPKPNATKFVRLQNKTYAEEREVTMSTDHIVLKPGVRILTDVTDTGNGRLRNLNHVYRRVSTGEILMEAEGSYYKTDSVYREAPSLILNGNLTIKKGSTILLPPNRVEVVNGVFSNGQNGYRILTNNMKLTSFGNFSYEVGAVGNIKVGMVVNSNGIQDPITKIYYNGQHAQLLLKSGTLMPVR